MGVTEDGSWIYWQKAPATLVVQTVAGGEKREIALPGPSQIVATPEGLRILPRSGARFLLKLADFAAGAPAEVPRTEPRWEDVPTRKWNGHINPGAREPGRKKDGQTENLAIPANQAYSVAPDGSLYYADRSGNVVKVTP